MSFWDMYKLGWNVFIASATSCRQCVSMNTKVQTNSISEFEGVTNTVLINNVTYLPSALFGYSALSPTFYI